MSLLPFTYLTKQQMEKLSTKRLLAYKRQYLSYNPFYYCSICGDCCCVETRNRNSEDIKSWENAYQYLKDILSTREHIERRK